MRAIAALLMLPTALHAMPGFVKAYKHLHPNATVNCTTCHKLRGGHPTEENVTADGYKKYKEMLAAEKKKPRFFSRDLTLNAGPEDPTFIIFGDTRTDPNKHAEVVQHICQENSRAVFHVGDIVFWGARASQWAEAMQIEDCLIKSKSYYPACGNHEGSYCVDNDLRTALGLMQTYYSVDLGGFTFLILDSYNPTDEQAKWLAGLPTGKKYIPVFHYPAYPTLSGHNPSSFVKGELVPQFKRLNVKLSFNGHNHGYDRALVDGITYVTSGGGGAPLSPCGDNQPYTQSCVSDYHYVKCAIQGSTISCSTKLLSGDTADSFSVTYP